MYVRNDAGSQVATLFVRGGLDPPYAPARAMALLRHLTQSSGTSAGITLGVRAAVLRAYAPPAALERLLVSIDSARAEESDPSGRDTIGSADGALTDALPFLFHSYPEVPIDFIFIMILSFGWGCLLACRSGLSRRRSSRPSGTWGIAS